VRLILPSRFKCKVQEKQDKINKKRTLTALLRRPYSFSS